MDQNIPTKRHPFLAGNQGLDFGEELVEVYEMDENQKADVFLTKYMDVFDPLVTYERFFSSSAKGVDYILSEVKRYYRKLVVNGTWSERKYVTVINDLFENLVVFSPVTLDRSGLMYEKQSLASQRRERSTGRRRR